MVRFINHLRVIDLFQQNCNLRKHCSICRNAKGPTNCKSANIGYSIICKTCKDRQIEKSYEGETCRNAYIRGNEHLKALQQKSKHSVLLKHVETDHNDEKDSVEFQMRVVGRFKTALSRQIDEGVRIQRKPTNSLLNSKSEFHGPAIKRKVLETENTESNRKQCQKS